MPEWSKNLKAEEVPKQYKEFVRVLGQESALKLFQNFGGEQIYIPDDADMRRVIRNREIQKHYAQGASIQALGTMFGLSYSSIYRIVCSGKPTSKSKAGNGDAD